MHEFLTSLEPSVPVVVPAVMSAIIALLRKNVLSKVPSHLYPVLLTAGAALVNAIAAVAGADVSIDLGNITEQAFIGASVGLSTVGVHQLAKKTKKPAP